jgi:5-methylcytosine-specific restriction endonuclease McrA
VILRACIDCGTPSTGSRCAAHRRLKQRIRTANRGTARAVIAAAPACADCGATTDLTSDHVRPLARGGSNAGPQRVLCRRHNSSRGGALAGNEPRGRQ